ncbi:phosphatase [Flavivirga jejuensis]|uniref:Phosphatase n=1 Tax=Flavivirga jejuensis TaxID=870487 RepID=A0ABT8WQ07_9FLAO|nr:phosphatase [Flavivirga jejuensis]MDO5974981.1 phosphatase [Flavivirga jejuensis]
MKKLLKLFLLLLVLTTPCLTVISCDIEDGKDGANGANGEDGIDGENGEDGEDGQDASVYLIASKTPNFLKVTSEFSNLKITPILSSEDVIPNSPDFVYGSMADGAGLLAEDDGTFTLINNIEADFSIARITLNKHLRPVYGEYILNATATASTAQCSGSMITPEEHGFGPLYLSGGEWGGSSQGVFVTDPYKDAANADIAEMLPTMGQWTTENAVAIHQDAYADKTVVFIGDDQGEDDIPSGQLGMYVGDKGDLNGGKLYGLKVTTAGITYEVDMAEGTEYDAEFVELEETEINALDAECKAKGLMGFSRLEDIDWRRGSAANNREIYFAVTGRDKPDLHGKGTISGRIYKVTLNDTDPTGAAKITCVLDGDIVGGTAEEFLSPDNILVTENYAYIQEDPAIAGTGNKAHYARLYQYNLNSGELKVVAECDQITAETKGYGFAANRWEITGMIDITDIVNNGKNTFLAMTQNHNWNPADGTSFTDPLAITEAYRDEGSILHLITGLDR